MPRGLCGSLSITRWCLATATPALLLALLFSLPLGFARGLIDILMF